MYASTQPISITIPTRNFHHILPELYHQYPEYVKAFTLHDQASQVVVNSRIALELVVSLSNRSFSGYAILCNFPPATTFRDVASALATEHIDVSQVSSELKMGGYIVALSARSLSLINSTQSFKIANVSSRPLVALSVDQIVDSASQATETRESSAARQVGFRKSQGAVMRLSNGSTVSGFRSWRTTIKFPGITLPRERE